MAADSQGKRGKTAEASLPATMPAKSPVKKPRAVRQRAEQQRAVETREKIIDAAEQEFASNGFEGTSTREIAKRAGVQHTMITYHFAGKDGLWHAVFDRLSGEFVTLQRDRLEGLRGVDNKTKLRLILEEFIRYSAKNLNFHKLMTHASTEPNPRLDTIVNNYVGQYFKMVTGLIELVQKEGWFIEGEPNHLHYLFIGASTRIFMQTPEVIKVMGRSPLEKDFVDMHIEKCLELFFRD